MIKSGLLPDVCIGNFLQAEPSGETRVYITPEKIDPDTKEIYHDEVDEAKAQAALEEAKPKRRRKKKEE